MSERPPAPAGLPPLARMSLVQRLIAKGELEDNDELRAAVKATRGGAGSAPAGSRRPVATSPIEAAARRAADGRDSTEILDEHELDLLRLSEPLITPAARDRALAALDAATPLSAPLPQRSATPADPFPRQRSATPTEPLWPPREAPAQAGEPAHEALLVRRRSQPPLDANGELPGDPTEVRPSALLSTETALRRAAEASDEEDDEDLQQHPQMSEEDFVPTRLARRPRVQAPAVQRVPPEILQTPVFRDREITERISIPPLASSIAPAARTVRPHLRPQKGMGGWQLALVAMLLIGAGLGVARLRRESAAAALTARVRSAVSAALQPSVDEVVAQPAPTVEPAPAKSVEPSTVMAPEESVAPPNSEAAQQLAADLAAAETRPRKARAAQEPSAGSTRASRAEARAEPAAPTPAVPEPAVEERRPAKAAPASAADVPAQPSRDEVRAALNAVIPELQKCAGSLHGTADVTMTVRSGGVVSYAVVAGTFAGTPEGSCIARTVKLAKFPAFSDPSVRVSYPFDL